MIFIAILDPRFSQTKGQTVEYAIQHNVGYQKQLQWCQIYCSIHRIKLEHQCLLTTRNDFSEYDCSNYIKQQLSLAFNKHDNVYVYFHCHGQTTKEGEYVHLNNQSKLWDREIMDLLRINQSKHISIFFETCHASGIYKPTEKWYTFVQQFQQNPKYIYNFISYNGRMVLCAAPGNFTLFFCSITEDQSYTDKQIKKSTGELAASGTATHLLMEIIPKEKTLFDYKPTEIRDLLNKLLYKSQTKQYAIVESPVLIPVWLF